MQSRLTMSDSTHLMTWVTRRTKEAFGVVARRQGLSESALLKRLIEVSLMTAGVATVAAPEPIKPIPLSGRLSIRLPTDDLAALRERATAREMPTSTYTSLLIRAHLRALTPLPTAELAALKLSVAELGAIGRNLNQVARAVNQGEQPSGPSRADLQAMLRALTGLRDHTKALINANLASWESGHEKTPD
jgi:hypothetical protein